VRPADNPFRSDRIEALPYEPPHTTWPLLLDRLASLQFRAAVVGPHGSGKTTLLDRLASDLHHHHPIHRLFFNDSSQRPGPHDLAAQIPAHFTGLVLLDGAEQLPLTTRLALHRLTRSCRGLILTCHRRLLWPRLPVLLHTSTDPHLMHRLLRQLLGSDPSPDIMRQADALFIRHRGNLRLVWRSLYDITGSVGPPAL
jgi:energy-coupling factor transporter ATP-binding protein EcfA2